jgi:hypothetical protein
VADKAREEVRQLQRHSRGAGRVNAWDEMYLRAKAQAAEVPPVAALVAWQPPVAHLVLCMHQLLILDWHTNVFHRCRG